MWDLRLEAVATKSNASLSSLSNSNAPFVDLSFNSFALKIKPKKNWHSIYKNNYSIYIYNYSYILTNFCALSEILSMI